jgi:hypothetical protein
MRLYAVSVIEINQTPMIRSLVYKCSYFISPKIKKNCTRRFPFASFSALMLQLEATVIGRRRLDDTNVYSGSCPMPTEQ